jgi:hypothetical protein
VSDIIARRAWTYLAPVHARSPLTSQTSKLAPTEPESAQTTPGDELVCICYVNAWMKMMDGREH